MVVAAGRAPTAECGIYDPFAGTGTIVIEALRRSLPAFASDIDPEAVRLTRARLADLASERETLAAGLDDAALLRRVFVHDIRAGLPTRVNARLIAGNLPWGDKVQLDRRTELFDALGPIAAETVAAGGACALLTTNHEQLMARLRRHVPGDRIAAHRISLLGQQPAIVTVSGHAKARA